jgi:hypothetical protein
MGDLGITLSIKGGMPALARLAGFLRDLDARGVDYSLTLEHEGWSQTYDNKAWREASRSPTFDPPPT